MLLKAIIFTILSFNDDWLIDFMEEYQNKENQSDYNYPQVNSIYIFLSNNNFSTFEIEWYTRNQTLKKRSVNKPHVSLKVFKRFLWPNFEVF